MNITRNDLTIRDERAKHLGIRCLADLPNQEHFLFVGVRHDLSRTTCYVKKDDRGCHYIEGGATYIELLGWLER
jgi:hypothetical protein